MVHANQKPTSTEKFSIFWLRAIPQTSCSKNSNAANIRGIITYKNPGEKDHEPLRLPTTSPHNYTDSCIDEDPTNLIPIITPDFTPSENIIYNKSLPVGITLDANNHYHWTLNGTSMQLDWANPTLLRTIASTPDHDSANNSHSHSHPRTDTDAVIDLPDTDSWTLIIIETTLAAPHPVHLHGHDFLIIAQGQGPYRDQYRPPADAGFSSTPSRALNLDLDLDLASTKTKTQTQTPTQTPDVGVGVGGGGAITFLSGSFPKRDTALLPASGHLVIAFKTDNPGAWLLHCHIGWHFEQGFGVQFVEREDEVRRLFEGQWRELGELMGKRCGRWEKYWGKYGDENGSGV
jgi:FtsP/CotA-like multicopper oxidase with cupredoxin domain